jgi:hypothetical protein
MPLEVGSAYSSYELRIDEFRRNVAEVKREWASLEKLGQRQPARIPTPQAPAASRAAAGNPEREFEAAARAANAQARAMEQLRRSEFQAALAAQDHAGKVRLIEAELSRTGQATARYNQLLAQKARAEQAAARESAASARAAGGLQAQFGELAGSLGTLGTVGGVLALGRVTYDLAQAGAQAQLVEGRFNSLAQSAGTTGDALMTALRAASGGEITDLNLQLSANRAIMLGVADSAGEMATLMAIARDRAQNLGISAQQAFDDLIVGLGRASPEILDNLAIQVSAEEANKAYAASIGKTVEELTKQERTQALVSAVIAQSQGAVAAMGQTATTNAASFAALNTTLENTKTQLTGLLATGIMPNITAFNALTAAATTSGGGFSPLITAAGQVAGAFQGLGATFPAIINSWGELTAAFTGAEGGMQRTQEALANLVPGAALLRELTSAGIQGLNDLTGAQLASVGMTYAQRSALDDLAGTSEYNRIAADQLRFAFTHGQLSAEELAAAIVALQGRHNAAAASAIAQGGAMEQMGNKATAQIPKLEAVARALALVTQRGAALGVDFGGPRGRAIGGGKAGPQGALGVALKMQARQTEELQQAQLGYARVTGNTAQQVAILRQRQQGLNKSSAEWLEIESQIVSAQKAGERAAGGGGRKGAAAAKLSDQQKLNNTLIAAEQRADQQLEQAAAQHAINIEKIERDHQARLRAADQSFHLARLSSRLGFYSQLGQIEDAGIRQELSARYEQAAQEAARIAATQGADAAQAYLQAERGAIEAEGRLQASIATARKEGRDSDAEYQEGLLRLQQESSRAEVEAARQAGSQIANDRQQRLADEEARFTDSQGKIALTAEQAAERQVAAAQRAGKEINTTTSAVNDQASALRGVATAANTAGGAIAATDAPAPQTPAQQAAQLLLVRDADVITAITAQTEMQRGKFDALVVEVQNVRRAVDGLRGTVAVQ